MTVLINNLYSTTYLPMNAIIIEYKSLERFLQPIDIDERDDEDRMRAIGKFEYPYIPSKRTFKVVTYRYRWHLLLTVKDAVSSLELTRIIQDVS
jgi:hypothetical protein